MVFGDILLDMFEYMEPNDLVRARQVCALWRNLIDGNIHADRTLWLAPTQPVMNPASGGTFRWNPRFRTLFHGRIVVGPQDDVAADATILRNRWGLGSAQRNRFLPAIPSREAIVRKMFLSDPPIQRISIFDPMPTGVPYTQLLVDWRRSPEAVMLGGVMTTVVHNVEGLKIGDLLNWLERCPSPYKV
jgi:hypothetical protein